MKTKFWTGGRNMMIKYSENYLTTRWQRSSTKAIALELSKVVNLGQISSGSDTNLAAQQKLLEIEGHLSYAHELYLQAQYSQAIDEYKLAQGLIYQMMFPSFTISVASRPDAVFPLDGSMFNCLLSASLELVEAIAPRTIEADFGLPFVEPPKPGDPLIRFSDLGVNITDGILRSVHYDCQMARVYVEREQWERAEFFYKRAKKALETGTSPEAKAAKASIDLSLAAVYIQMGRTKDAQTLLTPLSAFYKSTNDIIGLAQVNYNLGAAVAKEGLFDQANNYLKQAKQYTDQAQGLAPATAQPAPAGSSPIIPLKPVTSLIRTNFSSSLTGSEIPSKLENFPFVLSVSRLDSTQPAMLRDLADSKGLAVTYRQPGKGRGWNKQWVQTKTEQNERSYTKELGVLAGGKTVKLQWSKGGAVPADPIINNVYKTRVDYTNMVDVVWRYDLDTDFALKLPHIYYFEIPIALGDCYNGLGDFDTAESYYLGAANYQYINNRIEVPALWRKIAENVLEWGNGLYQNGQYQDALGIYRKVSEPPGTAAVIWADAPLYKHPKLKLVGDKVKTMLANYAASGTGDLNPVLAAVVLTIRTHIFQINAGLDYYGAPADLVPIWSFDYLQNVARYFAQQAIHAEREFINFQDRSESEALTRQELKQAVDLGVAEEELAQRQLEAALAEKAVYQAGKDLAHLRKDNANANYQDYSKMSWDRIWLNSDIAWYSSQNPWELDNEIEDTNQHIHEVISEDTEKLQRITRDYELAAMGRQTQELAEAEEVAQAQLNAANSRVEIAKQMKAVADLRHEAAKQNLDAFNKQFFTPEVWNRMGSFMRDISDNYLYMAIKIARLMQRAYNFENDLNRNFIKADYSTDTVKGMLAGDALLLDIDSFTYDQITTVKRKEVPIKQTISLAERYPFLFETKFKQTGRMEFETRLEDFDLAYPGTYRRRIESVEVEVEGILPPSGVRGILTSGGISRYRTAALNQVKFRIQPRETLVLSEYRLKGDALVFPDDNRILKVFEGAGVAGSWILEMPKSANDFDYSTITDIRLTFYYNAFYSDVLAGAVKAKLATFAALNFHSRSIALRWVFPDAFFHFQDIGQLAFSLDRLDFAFNEPNPRIRNLSVLVITETGTNPSPWKVRLGVPAHPETIPANPNAKGEISVVPNHPWQPLKNGAAIGNYLLEIRANENPGLAPNGVLKLNKIKNVLLILEYEFTPLV